MEEGQKVIGILYVFDYSTYSVLFFLKYNWQVLTLFFQPYNATSYQIDVNRQRIDEATLILHEIIAYGSLRMIMFTC